MLKKGECAMSLVLEFVSCVVKNLGNVPEDAMQNWIENPLALQKALLVLCPSNPEFKVFKTIKLGTGLKSADNFRQAIKSAGMKIGDWANGILGQSAFTAAAEETEVDLVVVSVAELGFKKGTTREKIYARAKELGLELCPAEIGPQLRLQYTDQPNSEWLIIAMEPICLSDGGLRLFHVVRSDSGLWLRSLYGYPGCVWGPGNRFLFVRRKYQ